ncbi:hypothetical protein WJX73_006679 [Symbiochloris irregularis]|uniref:F-box domain-containing protein n=1 Tax=Symbiochloris irregularis TaxID=706552 RepID=A0AAW1NXM6_9CHLO
MSLLGVGDALQHLILPTLDARCLAHLACTSKALRQLVYEAPASVWVAAARRCLPVAHPLGRRATRDSVQVALQRFADVNKNIRAGVGTCKLVTTNNVISFNAVGSHIALVEKNFTKIYEIDSGCCVADYEGLGVYHLHPTWAKGPVARATRVSETKGMLIVWLDGDTLAVYVGDLSQGCWGSVGSDFGRWHI